MKLSVIIPTYNRASVLKQCLEKLATQTIAHENYEIIVVDDGSTDDTSSIVKACANHYPRLAVQYFKQKNQGQGNARNKGIQYAHGDIILFMGDDIFVLNDFLEQHLCFHELHPEREAAVLGRIEWDENITVSAFMRWLTNGSSILGKFGGHQFAFEKLTHAQTANYNFFYTSNISLKKSLLQEDLFDPRFTFYGWEDIELGYRLEKKYNLQLFYNQNAVGYHHHEIDMDSFMDRMSLIGKSTHIIDSIHPELRKKPSFVKRSLFRLLSNPLNLFILKYCKQNDGGALFDLYYYALSKKFFLKGYYAGLDTQNI